MADYSIVAQIIVALSIAYVWIFRFDNIETEFNQYGLNTLTRSFVDATKIALSTLLVVGIWLKPTWAMRRFSGKYRPKTSPVFGTGRLRLEMVGLL